MSFTVGASNNGQTQGGFFPSVKSQNRSDFIEKADASRKNAKAKRAAGHEGTSRITSFFEHRQSLSHDRSSEILIDTTSIVTDTNLKMKTALQPTNHRSNQIERQAGNQYLPSADRQKLETKESFTISPEA